MSTAAWEDRKDSSEKVSRSRSGHKARKDVHTEVSRALPFLSSSVPMKPVASMTGFAVAARPTAIGQVTVELKSVNSRFLDLSVRYPDELRSVEPALREAISARVNRGKMECRLAVGRAAVDNAQRLNPDALGRLAGLAAEVTAALPDARPLTAADVLGWPGIVD